MSGDVGSGSAESAVVGNVGVAVGILLISHSVPEIHSTSGLMSAILEFCCRRMSLDVGSGMAESAVVGNGG